MLTSEYLLLARTKGLTKRQAVVRHAMRNAMVPILPMILGEFIGILSGSLIIEKIFSINDIYHLEMVGHSVLTWLLDFYIQNLFCRSREYRDRTLDFIVSSYHRIELSQ